MQSNAHLAEKISVITQHTHYAQWFTPWVSQYLGLLISSDLSWSNHIQSICSKAKKILGLLYRSICSKAKKILGLLYRKYCKFSDQATLFQLYIYLVRPHLEYSAPVWNPHLQRDIQMLERTQKFACRMCIKTWNAGYEELQNTLQLPSLSNRRLFHKLCTIFKVIRVIFLHM